MELIALAVVFLALLALSRMALGAYGRRTWRADVAWWFLLPVTKAVVGVGVLALAAPFVLRAGIPLAQAAQGHGPLGALPLGVQALLALLVTDFASYWMHRAHHGALWSTHAVHHSSRELDWLASVRGHPLNAIAQRAPILAALVLMGFDLSALAASFAGLGGLGILVHMRVDWDWGPLRRVLVSPRFHRWHHARDHDCNYAGLLPLWDVVFGTFHLPDHGPEVFGTRDDEVPDGWLGQLLHPFVTRDG